MKRSIALLTVLLAFVIFILPTHAEEVWHTCPPENATYWAGQRLMVKCEVAYDDGIQWFACPLYTTVKKKTKINPEADYVWSAIMTAIAAGNPLAIRFDPEDTSGIDVGCLSSNCRLIKAIAIDNLD